MIDHPELFGETRGQMIYFENEDGRLSLFFPFHDKVLVGTTDIPVDNPDTARCDEREVDYILESIRLIFPALNVDRSHIVYWYSGVRPLPASSASTPGQISRDHSFPRVPPGNGIHFPIYSLVGGKWTTFRAFAEQMTDQLLNHDLKRSRIAQTDHLAIGGGKGYPQTETERIAWLENAQKVTQLSHECLDTLLNRYGTRAESIANFLTAAPDVPLSHHADFSRREIVFMAECEDVLHLDDVVLRRTLLALLGQLDRALLEEIAGILAEAPGWSTETTQSEIVRSLRILETDHGVRLV